MKQITEKKILTDIEVDNLIAYLERNPKDRDSILIRLTLFTGSRQCEVLAVRPLDLGEQTVTIYGVKGSHDRTIPIANPLWKDLLDYIENNFIGKSDRIFPISTRHYRRIWDMYRPASSSEKGLHSLRHTFGVKLYNNCKDIKTVQKALGHSQINNTNIYLEYVETTSTLRGKMNNMFKKKL